MTFGAIYLAFLSAFTAQVGHTTDADPEETVMLAIVCGVLLIAGCVLLILSTAGGW